MLPYRDSRLTRIFLALFFLTLIGYAYYEARGYLHGPSITVPQEILRTEEQFILLKGTTERIASLRMNGAPITVTQEGSFEEPFLLAPGLNRIVFDAEDKYGRTSQQVLQVFYVAQSVLPQKAATSTPSSATSSSATSTP